MEVIAGFVGSDTRAAQLELGAAFSHSSKKLARLAKRRSSYNAVSISRLSTPLCWGTEASTFPSILHGLRAHGWSVGRCAWARCWLRACVDVGSICAPVWPT